MSGSRLSGSRSSATSPKTSVESVSIVTVTGRLSDPETMDMRADFPSGSRSGLDGSRISRGSQVAHLRSGPERAVSHLHHLISRLQTFQHFDPLVGRKPRLDRGLDDTVR